MVFPGVIVHLHVCCRENQVECEMQNASSSVVGGSTGHRNKKH